MAVISYREALNSTLRSEMQRDEDVFLIGEEIGTFEGSYKITEGLLEEFGSCRVRDILISEEGFTGIAIGAAMLGLRPVLEYMTLNFSLLALDQVVNHAAKIYTMFGGQTTVPMVIRAPGGGGQQLAATHSQNLEVWYAHVPGMVLENLSLYNTKGEVPEGEHTTEIGTAAIAREGSDLTVISYSRGVRTALQVAEELAEDGVSVEVVDLRSLRPLDRRTFCESVQRTTRAVVLEDDWLSYGIGAEVAASVQEGAFDFLDAPVRRVAAAEVPLPYAKTLERAALPDADDLERVIRDVL